ncbi:hypothetical protein VNO80_07348 [Phaseolus coccineus]|uniref:Glycosyltransferase N-terminal domain-containing protein n=1 Tax=Phaseolus coccineus TaxID=3886 RepID=A0AAN9RIF1_PHACN
MAFNGALENAENEVLVILIPFLAQGHLNPLLHFARLIVSYNIPVHYVGTITHIRQATRRYHNSISNSNIYFHRFEVPPFVSPPPNPNNNAQSNTFPSHLLPSFEATYHLRDPFRQLLHSLSSQAKRVLVIHDSLMAYVAQDATNMPNVKNYTFHISSAFYTSLHFWEKMEGPKACMSRFLLWKDVSLVNSWTSLVLKVSSTNSVMAASTTKAGPLKVLKVGLIVKDCTLRNVVVGVSVVENAVRRLMETKEGDEMRDRAMRFKNVIHRSMDEGGVTSTEMDSFIAHITK